MKLFTDIFVYLLETFGTLFLVLVLLRFLFQLVRADFYNPISQGIARFTNPILIPVRRVIPGLFGIDIASLAVLLCVQVLIAELIALVAYQTSVNVFSVLIVAILGTLNMSLYIGFACILIMVISSFVAPHSTHPIILLARQLLDPLVNPIHKLIPPMGGLDFSVMIIGIGLVVIQKILVAVAASFGGIATLVIGF